MFTLEPGVEGVLLILNASFLPSQYKALGFFLTNCVTLFNICVRLGLNFKRTFLEKAVSSSKVSALLFASDTHCIFAKSGQEYPSDSLYASLL